MDRYITIKQFCESNNVSRSTAYREHQAGRLPMRKVGRATRIAESDVLAWQQSLIVAGRFQSDQ